MYVLLSHQACANLSQQPQETNIPCFHSPRPSTNSCHWWQSSHCVKSNQTNSFLPRPVGKNTRRGHEESLAEHWDLQEIKQQEKAQRQAKLEKTSPGWAERQKPGGARKSFGTSQEVICFQSQKKSTHYFYLEGNKGTSDGYPSLTCSGLQATSGGPSPVCHAGLWVINPPFLRSVVPQ